MTYGRTVWELGSSSSGIQGLPISLVVLPSSLCQSTNCLETVSWFRVCGKGLVGFWPARLGPVSGGREWEGGGLWYKVTQGHLRSEIRGQRGFWKERQTSLALRTRVQNVSTHLPVYTHHPSSLLYLEHRTHIGSLTEICRRHSGGSWSPLTN